MLTRGLLRCVPTNLLRFKMAEKDESKVTLHIKSTKEKMDIEILSSENVSKVSNWTTNNTKRRFC